MNREIQDVDSNLADVGQRCNPRVMEKKNAHLNQAKAEALEKGMVDLHLLVHLQSLIEARCGQTIVWGATLSAPALRYFDLAAVEKTRLFFVDCEAFRRIATIAQDRIAGENRASIS